MRRIIILVAITLFAVGSVFADESILIDFSKLVADNQADDNGNPTQNKATTMDFSNVAGGSFTDDQKAVMKTSLAIANWEVVLNSSSRTLTNEVQSFTREAPSKQWEKVMGVRIHFPVETINSSARIKPPFEIPAFEPQAEVGDDGSITPSEDSDGITSPSRFEDGYGIVKNVGTIKSIAVNAYGLNFPHALSAILIDGQGNEKIVFIGYLNYDGWGQLTWNNPAYITEVRNRDLRLYPIYPDSTPFVKFGGFLIQKNASVKGGDFVGYFKDVKIIYDKAVLDTERDIEDESLWNIIKDKETAKKNFEMTKFGHNQVMRYLDSQKQAKETSFTPTPTAGEGDTQ